MLKELVDAWNEYQQWVSPLRKEHFNKPLDMLKGDFNGFILWLSDQEAKGGKK